MNEAWISGVAFLWRVVTTVSINISSQKIVGLSNK